MRSTRFSINAFLIAMLLLAVAGCASQGSAPAQFTEGVDWVARQHEVSDARTQRIADWPCLRVDPVLLDRLDAVLAENDIAKAKSLASGFVDEAHRLSLSVTEAQFERLDDAACAQLLSMYFNGIDLKPTPEIRRLLVDEFRHRTDLQAWLLRERIDASQDVASLRTALKPVRERVEPSIKDASRSGQKLVLAAFALPAVMARDAIHAQESTCQMDETFEGAVHYAPSAQQTMPARMADVEHWDLLVKYAPTFVQEHPKKVGYDRKADQIGRVGVLDDRSVTVDGSQPVVYGYTRSVMIGGRPYIQLTYATWYPERPKLKSPIDAEAGLIDGATFRITLDSNLRPCIFETLNNCGCHHRLYPSASIEDAAVAQYEKPLQDKVFVIERDVDGKYDLIIPKVLRIEGEAIRPFVRCRAGTHAIVDVDVQDLHRSEEPIVQRHEYQLLPYDELERLHSPGGRVYSMFEPDGLVRGARRMEGTLFNPLGMLSAGQPRQRGTQLIHWDQFDFDHPKLLESTLRLPDKF